ncbi:MAG TPA: glycosyltransferase family 39 protein [Tepidisphaeraceae bacterium]|jgi:uncharacterized membrane protein|nr:glycosyltransferase family 39 protein [Tepidisphaeraceae bacterium]
MTPHTTRRQLVVLGLVLAVGAFVRFYHISASSLWLDEIWSIEMARGQGSLHDLLPDGIIHTDQPDLTGLANAAPWWKIWSHLQRVIHPPLYFVVMRWWMDFFGNSSAAIRSLSTVASLLAIIVFFDVCRLLHGTRIALIAAAIMTLAIGQINIAQEARSYPQLILLGLCCCDALVRIQLFGANSRRLAALAISLVAFMLTHYFAAGPVAVLGLYALIRLRGRNRTRAIAAFAAAGLITAVLWGWQFQDQMRTFPSFRPDFLQEDMPGHIVHTFARAIRLPMQYLGGKRFGEKTHLPLNIAVVLILIYSVARLRSKPELLLWILWLVGTAGWITAMDLAHDSRILEYLHYTILASPGVYALIATIDWPKLGRFRSALPLGAIAALAVLVALQLRNGVRANMDFRALSHYVDSHTTPHELLVYYHPGEFTSPGAWYMCYKYYSPHSHHPWMTLHAAADADVLAQLGPRQSLMLISADTQLEGSAILPDWRTEQCFSNSAGRACQMARLAPTPVH